MRRCCRRACTDARACAVTYLLAKMVDELLVATVASVGFSAAAFFAIGFQGSFGLFWLVYLLVLYIGIVLAYWIAAISPNMDVANALLPIYVTTQLLFGGFILDYHAIPVWWKWFSYLDFMRVRAHWRVPAAAQRPDARACGAQYAWGALMVNQFSGPKGDPIFINGKTVLEQVRQRRARAAGRAAAPDVSLRCPQYHLKNYVDHSSANYTWYRKNAVRGPAARGWRTC